MPVVWVTRVLSWVLPAVAMMWGVPASSAEDTIVGRAAIIDGDTIEIDGIRIRLYGIDAPEFRQTCRLGDRTYACGEEAAFALADEIGQRALVCDPVDDDRYGRVIAVCWVGEEDINARMVSQGWALAYRRYSREYVANEDDARLAQRGLWRGQFDPPWDWRTANRRLRAAREI